MRYGESEESPETWVFSLKLVDENRRRLFFPEFGSLYMNFYFLRMVPKHTQFTQTKYKYLN